MLIRTGSLMMSGAATGEGPPWTPSRISGCVGWWDMTDVSHLWQDTSGTSAITAHGQSIARVDDQSGNGKNFLQSTSGLRPTYNVSGSQSWLAGNGTTSFMSTAAALFAGATQTRTIALAFRQTAATAAPVVVASTSSGSYISVSPNYDGDGLYYSQQTSSSYGSTTGLSVGTDYVVVDMNSVAANVVRANGAETLNGAALNATTTIGSAAILGDDIPATISWSGRIYALAVFSAVVSGQNLRDLELWLARKARITI